MMGPDRDQGAYPDYKDMRNNNCDGDSEPFFFHGSVRPTVPRKGLDQKREGILELMLGVLLESIRIDLPEQVQEQLLHQNTGSWVVPHDLTAVASDLIFQCPSLFWMCNDEKCSLNFLAHHASSEFGSLQGLQWTLQVYFHTLENVGNLDRLSLSDTLSPLPIHSFWKVASLRILSVQFSVLTLIGSLSLSNGSRNVGINPGAVFSCDQVNMVDVIPRTSQEGTQLADVMTLLDAYPTPGLEWRGPIGPQDRFDSLADVLRCAYSLSEADGENLDTRSLSSQNQQVPTVAARKIDFKGSITDSLVMTGSLLATGASLATPVGAAVSVVALGAKDGIVAAASKGQASRGGEGYKLGDVTRGIVSSIHQHRQYSRKRNEQAEDDSVISRDSNPPPEQELPSLESNHHRYAGALGSSAGAAAGMAIAGPIGLLAGSLIGNALTRDVIHRRSRDQELEHASVSSRSFSTQETSENSQIQYQRNQDDHSQVEGWKFGDNIRNVVQRGKVANGRPKDDSYKFGDFSRGLFSKKK